jgi:hypothetical protein
MTGLPRESLTEAASQTVRDALLDTSSLVVNRSAFQEH